MGLRNKKTEHIETRQWIMVFMQERALDNTCMDTKPKTISGIMQQWCNGVNEQTTFISLIRDKVCETIAHFSNSTSWQWSTKHKPNVTARKLHQYEDHTVFGGVVVNTRARAILPNIMLCNNTLNEVNTHHNSNSKTKSPTVNTPT